MGKSHSLDDFKIGESVVPVSKKELTLVVIDIDKEKKKIICSFPPDAKNHKLVFTPGELEKEIFVRPPNIVDLEMPEDE